MPVWELSKGTSTNRVAPNAGGAASRKVSKEDAKAIETTPPRSERRHQTLEGNPMRQCIAELLAVIARELDQ